ncbi:fdxN element excision controlling factor protein XisI [Calothrix sp. NIES-4071]|nr:fdxN element excision controlling factor protein XisI [Calothrix sp. NIES-4071]BAZ62696.1 fdxN element excision controlling factor protein XisI [Calothrix sp. NIES-4105]
MDKLDLYREKVKTILTEYAEHKYSYGNIDVEKIFDKERDHYQILSIGWNNQKRIYNPIMHLDIKNEKIWIQENITEVDVAKELIEMGVPKSDVVIGFHPPEARQLTEFGVE